MDPITGRSSMIRLSTHQRLSISICDLLPGSMDTRLS